MAEQLQEAEIPSEGDWDPSLGTPFLSLPGSQVGPTLFFPFSRFRNWFPKAKDWPKIMLRGGDLTSTLHKMRQGLLEVS